MKRFIFALMTLIAMTGLTANAAEPVITPDGTYMYEKRDTCDLFMDV